MKPSENYFIKKLIENPKYIDLICAPDLSYFKIDEEETNKLKNDLDYMVKLGLNDEIIEKAINIMLKTELTKSKLMKD